MVKSSGAGTSYPFGEKWSKVVEQELLTRRRTMIKSSGAGTSYPFGEQWSKVVEQELLIRPEYNDQK
jgi:hypothetical protein